MGILGKMSLTDQKPFGRHRQTPPVQLPHTHTDSVERKEDEEMEISAVCLFRLSGPGPQPRATPASQIDNFLKVLSTKTRGRYTHGPGEMGSLGK